MQYYSNFKQNFDFPSSKKLFIQLKWKIEKLMQKEKKNKNSNLYNTHERNAYLYILSRVDFGSKWQSNEKIILFWCKVYKWENNENTSENS